MSPEQRQQFEMMQKRLDALERVENVSFIESIKRRLGVNTTVEADINAITLTDLADVDTDGVTNGQVIKFNDSNSTWENANDIDT